MKDQKNFINAKIKLIYYKLINIYLIQPHNDSILIFIQEISVSWNKSIRYYFKYYLSWNKRWKYLLLFFILKMFIYNHDIKVRCVKEESK